MRSRGAGRTTLAVLVTAWVVGAENAVAQTGPAVPARAPVTRRVVVSIPDRKLALLENDEVVRVYSVAVGAAKTPSPVGAFTIVNRISRPTYYTTGKVISPGPANPLGTRWLGLSVKGYGIHGTDNPSSIGHARSHGCIRMRNRDVEQLFERLQPGDVVELHAEPTAEIARLFAAPAVVAAADRMQ